MTAVGLGVYGLLLALAAAAVWRRPVVALYLWIAGLALHNAVMAMLYGAGIRGSALTAIQAWKEIVLGAALASVAAQAFHARRLPFRFAWVDALALTFAAMVLLYAVLPQEWLGGDADRHAIGLALKHDLVPVGAYFLGRSLVADLRPLAWTILVVGAGIAAVGLLDDYFVSIDWWRRSAVVDYFHDQLGYDYNGTGGLPENFVYNTGSEDHFLRRLVSAFLSPLASAYLLVVALLVSVLARPPTRVAAPLLALAAAGLLFTFSRSSLIALAGGLAVLAAAARRWWPAAAAVVTVAVAVAWVHVFPSIAPTGKWTHADLVAARENAERNPGADFDPTSGNEPSIRSHLASLREGARTVVRHPQGYGLGNAGQTASRTETPIKAGESNYTELGAETGLAGALLWIAWNAALLVGLLRRNPVVAAALAAALVLAVQTDVIGDPWMAYVLWALGGLALAAPVSGPVKKRTWRSTRASTSATST